MRNYQEESGSLLREYWSSDDSRRLSNYELKAEVEIHRRKLKEAKRDKEALLQVVKGRTLSKEESNDLSFLRGIEETTKHQIRNLMRELEARNERDF